MDGQPEFAGRVMDWLDQAAQVVLGWLTSPAAWSQFALLAFAFVAALWISRRIVPVLSRLLTPPAERTTLLDGARRFALRFLPLLMPLAAYGLTAVGEEVTRSVFGTGDVIAFGKRVFLFLAARLFVREVLTDPFLRLLGRYILIPAMALYALGVLDDIALRLEATSVELGNIRFSAMSLIRGAIAGVLLFWLGTWSNRQSAQYIKKQEELRPATRELAAKAAEVAIFGVAFLLLMSIMGIDLTAVAVLGGALGVGIGLGLQQIAANFVSGIILLIEGQTTVGDYVELDDGSAGTILRMTARACIIETVDGRWIVVPNDNFITSRVVNYSDAGKSHRYSVNFSVSYDTDINTIPPMVEGAVVRLDCILSDPAPSCELVNFGESGVEFEVEYWVTGIEDLTDDYASHVRFCIWNTLRDNGVQMPYPHRVVEIRNPEVLPVIAG